MRRAAKRDASEQSIIDALEAAGCFCFRLNTPVDLLILKGEKWHLMEVKTPGANLRRKDQEAQQAFCKAYNVPIVQTPEEALVALGLVTIDVSNVSLDGHLGIGFAN